MHLSILRQSAEALLPEMNLQWLQMLSVTPQDIVIIE